MSADTLTVKRTVATTVPLVIGGTTIAAGALVHVLSDEGDTYGDVLVTSLHRPLPYYLHRGEYREVTYP